MIVYEIEERGITPYQVESVIENIKSKNDFRLQHSDEPCENIEIRFREDKYGKYIRVFQHGRIGGTCQRLDPKELVVRKDVIFIKEFQIFSLIGRW